MGGSSSSGTGSTYLERMGLSPYAWVCSRLCPDAMWEAQSDIWVCARLRPVNCLRYMCLCLFVPRVHVAMDGAQNKIASLVLTFVPICASSDAGVIILLGASGHQGTNPGCENPAPKAALR